MSGIKTYPEMESMEGKMLFVAQPWNPQNNLTIELLKEFVRAESDVAVCVFNNAGTEDQVIKAPKLRNNDLTQAAMIVADIPSRHPDIANEFVRQLKEALTGKETPVKLISGDLDAIREMVGNELDGLNVTLIEKSQIQPYACMANEFKDIKEAAATPSSEASSPQHKGTLGQHEDHQRG